VRGRDAYPCRTQRPSGRRLREIHFTDESVKAAAARD